MAETSENLTEARKTPLQKKQDDWFQP